MKIRVTLIADIGKMLTDGEQITHMANIFDSTDISAWSEIDVPEETDEPTEEVGDTE